MDSYGHGSEGGGGGWEGLQQMLLSRTTREPVRGSPREVICEEHYYLCSLKPDTRSGDELLALIRGHWEIENRLHHVKDRTCHEDAQKLRRGAVMLSWLRSLAAGCVRLFDGTSTRLRQMTVAADPRRAITKLLATTQLQKHPLLL